MVKIKSKSNIEQDHLWVDIFTLFMLCRHKYRDINWLSYLDICFGSRVDLGPDHVQLTKVNWRLKVNWKNFQEIFCKIFPIDFVVVNHVLWVNSIENVKSQLQTSKVNCKLQISYTILRTNSYFCLFLLLISRKRKRNLNYEFVESYKP